MFEMNIIKKLKTSFQIGVTKDYRYLCHITNSRTIVYDMESWKEVVSLSSPKNPSEIRFTNDSKYLVVKNTSGITWVYRVGDFQLVKKIPSKRPYRFMENGFSISQGNDSILDIVGTKYGVHIALINFLNDEWNIISSFDNTHLKFNQYIASKNLHIFTLIKLNEITGYKEYRLIMVKENIKNKFEIQEFAHLEFFWWHGVIYHPIYDVYFLVRENELIVLDKNFQRIIKKISVVENNITEEIGYFQHIHISENGKYIVVTYSKYIFIISYEELDVVRFEKIKYASFAEYSDDNKYLFVGTWENGYVLENNLL